MKRISALIMIFLSMNSCVSDPSVQKGIQPGYNAINLASVIAVPTIILPDPSKDSSVDRALMGTYQIQEMLESKIINAFVDQPNINGYSFTKIKQSLDKSDPEFLQSVSYTITKIAQRFSSQDIRERLLISPKCLERKNFLDFYSFCVSNDNSWITQLNKLSSKIMNSDSALFVFVNHLKQVTDSSVFKNELAISLILVDTNNGNLIWGNSKFETISSPEGSNKFPLWSDLVNSVLSQDFWEHFPGRINKK